MIPPFFEWSLGKVGLGPNRTEVCFYRPRRCTTMEIWSFYVCLPKHYHDSYVSSLLSEYFKVVMMSHPDLHYLGLGT